MINHFEHYLAEDCPYGDETTDLLCISGKGTIEIISRDAGVAACTDDLAEFYRKRGLDVVAYVANGCSFDANTVLFSASGDLRTIFKLWRVSQTFLSMTCAIAGKTREMVEAAKAVNPDVLIATSRKTHLGFRKYELKAVKAGGGIHHRNSLSDSILITQNHLEVAGPVEKPNAVRKVEIEPRDDKDAFRYAKIADMLLLDHYTPDKLDVLVPLLRTINPCLEIAVGGINAKDVAAYAPYADVIVTTAPYYAMPLDMTSTIKRIES
ncbi:nicotinate-nucleotide pyrophosphorylase (carboxylating)/molybdenum transport protein [Methanohalophilus levihalophilus]|uniref:nicotinate-nucleotide pyrophosphorylase n=1 Tax=Methanohalophilus levihalophilus TaxID=1431282 RepID=UPI001AE5DD0C|nr:nicotinate-nucleotide pyrophosphorylase [Methanohalophilus levihalophilus]MBP2029706.1 nicotinate-nucleotide pyrophosphorylase (carboxylating)/molybdenum transport protein [Methanohalophilus levihalophilus]